MRAQSSGIAPQLVAKLVGLKYISTKNGGDATGRRWDVMNCYSGRYEFECSSDEGRYALQSSKRKYCDATAMDAWAYPIEEHARRRLANQIEPERW